MQSTGKSVCRVWQSGCWQRRGHIQTGSWRRGCKSMFKGAGKGRAAKEGCVPVPRTGSCGSHWHPWPKGARGGSSSQNPDTLVDGEACLTRAVAVVEGHSRPAGTQQGPHFLLASSLLSGPPIGRGLLGAEGTGALVIQPMGPASRGSEQTGERWMVHLGATKGITQLSEGGRWIPPRANPELSF